VTAPRTTTHLVAKGVTHHYGSVTALADITLEIEGGEFVTLLGPSGCGKTTLLRILAGFIRPSEGRILLGGRDITRVPPHRRPFNIVFQRATLFPYLNVFDNVAFGLKVARVRKTEIGARVREALALVRLEEYASRRSHELSGGQMQRIALARALVNRPEVLLLDEPLSALDLRIRLEIEVELRRIHRETGTTFVYVTHDQREALALSDRIVVFDRGCIEQVGPPGEIYSQPATPFAAQFVGDANVLPLEVTSVNGHERTVIMGGHRLTLRSGGEASVGPAWLVLRPESVRLAALRPDDPEEVRGVVRDFAFRGSGFTYRVDVPGLGEPLKAEVPSRVAAPYHVGSEVAIAWDGDAMVFLPRHVPDRDS